MPTTEGVPKEGRRATPTARRMRIIAQDPKMRLGPGGSILTTEVEIPYENLEPGPRGYRVHVVDYDASAKTLYARAEFGAKDDFADVGDARLLGDPAFHAQNVYAIVMRLLARFEFALGRRVPWGFGGHQLTVAPHAFAGANAYYSHEARSLCFGYFPDPTGKTVYTALSHDVVAHECTHALVDGLRRSYTFPSLPDQAAFHEAFADIVALLSVFSQADVVRALLPGARPGRDTVPRSELTADKLEDSALLGLAEQVGSALSGPRADVLRRAVKAIPNREWRKNRQFDECHLRGEVLSGAVLRTFVRIWVKRLGGWLPPLGPAAPGGGAPADDAPPVPIQRVAEDGADAAAHLLTMAIRGLDYCPVTDISFEDFLAALLTADLEVLPNDGKHKYRDILRQEFADWGIASESATDGGNALRPEIGAWESPTKPERLRYDCIHLDSLQRNEDEIFRFVWENRGPLGIYEDAYTKVISLNPCIRVAPDGFVLRETVAEYRQTLELRADQLGLVHPKLMKPLDMPDETLVRLYGGGVLLFDEFGRLKYHVHSRLNGVGRQQRRLEFLWENRLSGPDGSYGFNDGTPPGLNFAMMHVRRAGAAEDRGEWR